jgi:hypothetical protein
LSCQLIFNLKNSNEKSQHSFNGIIVLNEYNIPQVFQLKRKRKMLLRSQQVLISTAATFAWVQIWYRTSLSAFRKISRGRINNRVWGSFDAAGYTETDPYISYTLPFGLSIGMTDYYYPTHLDTT